MAIKHYTQMDMRVPPTEQTHLVRLGDMIDYVAGMTKAPVAVVLHTPFAAVYDYPSKTLTQTVPDELIIDGVTLALDDRVLIAGQLDKMQNGIYTVTTLGVSGTTEAVLTRADDFDESTKIANGMIIPVDGGDVNAGTRWKLTTGAAPFVLDSVTLDFAKDVVDFTKVVELIFPIEGDDIDMSYLVTHDLNTLNVTHELYEDATGETVVAGFKRVSANAVQVDFGVPLGAGNDMTLVLRAEVEPV